MKMKTSKTILTHSSLAFALAVVMALAAPSGVLANSHKQGDRMMPGQTAEQPSAMKKYHQKMMSDMTAQDAELTRQIAAINKAPEKKKMDLMATALTTMAEQRAAMHESMSGMMDSMMDGRPMMMNERPMSKGDISQQPMMKSKATRTAEDAE